MPLDSALPCPENGRAPLRDQVRDAIRSRITQGKAAPGIRLVERELAAELGVSRIPVREALRMLETEGFVQVNPRRGAVVRVLSRQEVEELFDVRRSLEVLACRRAAERATAAEIAALGTIIEAGEQAVARADRTGVRTSNGKFHDALILMAHNELLAALLSPLQDRLHWLFAQNENLAELVDQHRDLFAAIAARDADRAEALALAHVEVNRAIAVRLLFGRTPRLAARSRNGSAPARGAGEAAGDARTG
ncbi:GntR family transcriptional regulator [Amycolatopsis orientalis]|uniref:GntR family transcriptional regulator n=1 Tax=Amycolatopsis orientalis TaxID=31958 RepID=UPI0003AAD8BC|nr:GntR family transcriptional regulator [Amycolatopsis orientalis]